MNDKERYERETKAKGGSVPVDMRRNSKSRASASRDPHKHHQSEKDRESAGFATVDIEHVSDSARKAIMNRDI
jgi:hypothetical protein